MQQLERKEVDYILSYIARFLYFLTFMMFLFQVYLLARDGYWTSCDINWLFEAFGAEPLGSTRASVESWIVWLYSWPIMAYTFVIGVFFSLVAKRL